MAPAFDAKKHKREILLGGVLVAALAAFFYLRAGSGPGGIVSGQAVMASSDPAPAVAQAINKLGSVKLPGVLLDRLDEAKAPYDPTQRNIFRYGNIPPPPPSKEELARIEEARRQAEEARQKAIQEEQQRQAQLLAQQQAQQPPVDPATGLPVGVQPAPPPRPAPPAITLRYSGLLGAASNRMAVLYSGDDVILARVGDVVEKQFKVLDIGYEWVKIGYVDPQFADDYQKLRMGP